MGMKYRDPETGQLKELSLKAADTLPIGTIVDYDGKEVPEGWEEVEEEKDVYSTEEVKTNKVWIDGKPLYRKVFEQYITEATSYEIDVSSLKIDKVSKIESVANGSYTMPIYFATSDTDYYRAYITNNLIRIRFGSAYPVRPFTAYVIIEYTKTTD